MKRDLNQLAEGIFDLVVVGGGVYGLSTAYDAAQRGLRVALLEQNDFGSASSAATLKLIHGGLRYLQHLNFPRMRVSILERRAMHFMAPHLVQPLEFAIPCYGHLIRGPEALQLALLANDIISADRNRGLADPRQHIPMGRRLSKKEFLRRVPSAVVEGFTGAGAYYDGRMYNSERLTLAFGLSAVAQGAVLANYAPVIRFVLRQNRIEAAVVRDMEGGREFEVRGRMFVNMTGPWSEITTQLLHTHQPVREVVRSKGVQVVLKRKLSDYGFSIESRQVDAAALIRRGGRMYFAIPWRGVSMLGTTDTYYRGAPDDFRVTARDVEEFIDELRGCYPGARLSMEDVSFWVGGMRPVGEETANADVMKASHKYEVIDHARAPDRTENLVSVIGVKYTICRHIAERIVDGVFAKLGRPGPPCRTAVTRLAGGAIDHLDAFLASAGRHGFSAEVTRHLVFNYGAGMNAILDLTRSQPLLGATLGDSKEVLGAEVVHAVRHEMALKLADVVLRRTDLGSAGHPGPVAIRAAAALMRKELNWSAERTDTEVRDVEALYRLS